MRDILFKGKRKDNGEWVEGFYFKRDEHNHYIGDGQVPAQFFYEVIPETVGQFTGLTDKNGKAIFEGDIVKWAEVWEHEINGIIESEGIDQVVYKGNEFELKNKDPLLWLYGEEGLTLEVIGNIHDNPELLRSDNSL